MAKPERIEHVVKKVIGDASSQKVSLEAQILSKWEAIAGKTVAEHTKPMRINNGTLFILIDHPSWQFEFSTKHASVILQELKKIFGEENIKKIIPRVGTF